MAEAELLEACLQLNRRLDPGAGAVAGELPTATKAAGAVGEGEGGAKYSTTSYKSSHLCQKRSGPGSEGYFAAADVPAGTLLLVAEPVATVLDTDVTTSGSEAWNADTALLIIAVADAICGNQHVWDEVAPLFPRPTDMDTVAHWQCDKEDPELVARVEAALAKLTALSAAEQARIPDIVK